MGGKISAAYEPRLDPEYGFVKFCISCQVERPLEKFSPGRMVSGRIYYEPRCKRCKKRSRPRATRKSNKDDLMQYHFQLAPGEYEAWLEAQNHSCAICGAHMDDQERDLAVDHDHFTGDIRGLLCTSCNMGLGFFKDDVERMKRAIRYLQNDPALYATTDTNR